MAATIAARCAIVSSAPCVRLRASVRRAAVAAVAFTAITPAAAGATTLPARPTPLQLLGAPTSCPTADQASGADVGAELRRLVAERHAEAAEVLLDTQLTSPRLLIAACDPQRAATSTPLPSIAGTTAAPGVADEVGSGWRMVGGSGWSSGGAAAVGDRFTLPALPTGASVDVAVRTPAGVVSLRPALPADLAPRGARITGTAAAPVVAISGVGPSGEAREVAAPVTVPAPKTKLTLRAEGGRMAGNRLRLRVQATPGSLVFLTSSSAVVRSLGWGRDDLFGRRQLSAAVAGADGRARLVLARPGPVSPGREFADDRFDVLVVHPERRIVDGGACSVRLLASGHVAAPGEVRCSRDRFAALRRWMGTARKPYLRSLLAGNVDGPYGLDGLLRTGLPLTNASGILQDLLPAEQPIGARAPSAVTAPPRLAARRASTAPAPRARGQQLTSIAGLTSDDLDEQISAAPGGLGVADLNADARADLLVGADLPTVWMSAPGGGWRHVEFEATGDGGGLAGDLDGDGTADLVDAIGNYLLSSRSWATPPARIGPGDFDAIGGPGQLPWTDGWGGPATAPTPLADVTGDGRPELLSGSAVFASDAIAPGSLTVQPLVRAPDRPVRDALISELGRLNFLSYPLVPRAAGPPEVIASPNAGALLIHLEPIAGGDTIGDRPAGWLRVQDVDPKAAGGLGPLSAPIKVRSLPTLVDRSAQSDRLINVTVQDCASHNDCAQPVRLTPSGDVRTTIELLDDSYRSTSCAFIDDGPDGDRDDELLCSRPKPASTTDDAHLVVVSSESTGTVDLQRLPRVTYAGKPLVIDGYGDGFDVGTLAGGRRATVVLRRDRSSDRVLLIDSFE